MYMHINYGVLDRTGQVANAMGSFLEAQYLSRPGDRISVNRYYSWSKGFESFGPQWTMALIYGKWLLSQERIWKETSVMGGSCLTLCFC